jgi:hypothetical protein
LLWAHCVAVAMTSPSLSTTRKTCYSYQTLQASLLMEHRKLRQHCRSGIQAIS